MSQVAIPVTENNLQPSTEVPGWLVLSIDNMRLAVPQKDVKTVELASTLDVAVEGEAEAGWLEQDGKMWPVYGVDEYLSLQAVVPRSRRFCIMLHTGDKLVGFLCDQVRMLPSDNDLNLQDMPGCLVNDSSPLRWISLFEGKVVAVAKSGGLTAYMAEMEAKYGAE